MTQIILVINAGSSSIKFALFESTQSLLGPGRLRGEITGIGGRAGFSCRTADGTPMATPVPSPREFDTHAHALEALLDWLSRPEIDGGRIAAVGHRIVHGGERYRDAVRLDAAVLNDLDALVPLARLHQPFGLAGVRALAQRSPDLAQFACFDTAFHHSLPPEARRYALPRALTAAGIRRYGFHGLSYTYLAAALADMMEDFSASRVICAHLGSGSSLCAMHGGRSIATTMGFTPIEGLVMGTRAGSVDPGVLLYLLQERGMTPEALSHLLNHESGLLGISDRTSDMKTLVASDDIPSREAVESYVYSIVREIGALASCLGGLDALVFTAGIGERSASIRAAVCARLGWLGINIDPHANDSHAQRIDNADGRCRVLIVPTDEEQIIARETHRLLFDGS